MNLSGPTSSSKLVGLLAHLENALLTLDQTDAIHEAGPSPLSRLSSRPDEIIALAHEQLHVFPFKDVHICWRRLYEEASLWKVVEILGRLAGKEAEEGVGGHDDSSEKVLRNEQNVEKVEETGVEKIDWRMDIIRLCDMILIITGALGRRKLIDTILAAIDEDEVDKHETALDYITDNEERETRPQQDERLAEESSWACSCPAKRRRLSPLQPASPPEHVAPTPSLFRALPFPNLFTFPTPLLNNPVPRLSCPSLETFRMHIHNIRTPLILTNSISHWPALSRWNDLNYWLRRTHGGRRLVPVEVGRSYTDEGWGQKIMVVGEFLGEYLMSMEGNTAVGEDDDKEENGDEIWNVPGDGQESNYNNNDGHTENEDAQIGYLAQHDLLNQIPALRNDISIPDYCYVDPPRSRETRNNNSNHDASNNYDHNEDAESNDANPLLNIWLGPAHTISPAHTDPHHNILAQIFGRKYVRLFAPSEIEKMYPMSGGKDWSGKVAESKNNGKDEDRDEVEMDIKEGKGDQAGGRANEVQDVGKTALIDMGNTSRVDVGIFVDASTEQVNGHSEGAARLRKKRKQEEFLEKERDKFPLHAGAAYVDAILGPGQCLYIPKGWWHYVRSLEVGCSVSFWWD